jgi:DNA-binding NarL/FixJ family response regulator
MTAYQVLIADDDRVFREGLQMVLSDYYDNVLTTGNGPEAIDLVALALPDVVLIAPEEAGLESAQQIKARWPQIRVILLAVFDRYLDAVLEIGADGYLLKGCRTEELLAMIHRPTSLAETVET